MTMTVFQYLFSFEGRIGRLQFWIFLVIAILVLIFGPLIFGGGDPFKQGLISLCLLFLLLWPSLAIQVKRWHDINKPGYWVCINFVPVIGNIWALLELGFLPGSPASNNYGVPPLTRRPKPQDFRQSQMDERDRKSKAWLGLGAGISLVVLGNLEFGGSDSIIGYLSRTDIISGHIVTTMSKSSEIMLILNGFLVLAAWLLRLKIGDLIHYLIQKV